MVLVVTFEMLVGIRDMMHLKGFAEVVKGSRCGLSSVIDPNLMWLLST